MGPANALALATSDAGDRAAELAAPAAPTPGTMTADEAHSIAQQFVEQCIDNA